MQPASRHCAGQGVARRALIQGRDYVVPEDLYALADDVMLHRMRLSYEALADGLTGADVLRQLLDEFGFMPT